MMKNQKIRTAAIENNVKLWEIAEHFGISDANFSRKLRKEFSDSDTQKALQIIVDIAAKRREEK